MKDNRLVIDHFCPVPPILYSFETGEKFCKCIECGKLLLEEGTQYLIQKAIDDGETVIEYAQCLECYQKLESSYSKQTATDIWNFILDSVNFDARNQKLWATDPENIGAWLGECLTCGKPEKDCSSYTIAAWCDGEDVLFHNLPYIFCDDCQLKLHGLMSAKSRDEWNRWKDQCLDVPPALEQELPSRKFVFV